MEVDGKAAKHQYRYGVRHVSSHPACGYLVRDGTSGQRVVAEYAAILIRDDESPAGATHLIGQGPVFEPNVEGGFTAGKFIQAMSGHQGIRRAEMPGHAFSVSQGTVTAIRRSSPGLGDGGASSSALNLPNWSASRLKKT